VQGGVTASLFGEPFGLWELPLMGACPPLAEDPRPITPEWVQDFLDRWEERFTKTAGDENIIAAFFPKPFQRRTISHDFRPDKP